MAQIKSMVISYQDQLGSIGQVLITPGPSAPEPPGTGPRTKLAKLRTQQVEVHRVGNQLIINVNATAFLPDPTDLPASW